MEQADWVEEKKIVDESPRWEAAPVENSDGAESKTKTQCSSVVRFNASEAQHRDDVAGTRAAGINTCRRNKRADPQRVKEHTQQQGSARAKERKEQSQLQARTSMTALEANTDGASTQVIG